MRFPYFLFDISAQFSSLKPPVFLFFRIRVTLLVTIFARDFNKYAEVSSLLYLEKFLVNAYLAESHKKAKSYQFIHHCKDVAKTKS